MKAGSNTKEGFIYHELPDSGIPAQRLGLEDRVKFFLSKVDVKGKKVLDLGCNVGGISYLLAKAGANVIGVDYDEEAIKIGKKFLEDKKLEGTIDLKVQEITPQFLQELEKYDIVVWLSQWQWFVKQFTLEKGHEALFNVSQKADTLIFESAANDGKANIEGATQDTLEHWLIKDTAYSQVDRYKVETTGWHDRDVFICSKPIFEWRRHRNTLIRRINRKYVEKINENGILDEPEIRDIQYLQVLKDSPIAPKLKHVSKNSYLLTYEGFQIKKLRDADIEAILQELKAHNLLHRDITPTNLLWNGERVMLIDYGWTSEIGVKLETTDALGEGFKCPTGFDDAYSLRKVKESLDNPVLQNSMKSV